MADSPQTPPRYRSLDEFYPYYLSEHRNRSNRRLHFAGTTLGLLLLLAALLTREPAYLALALVSGYGLAWVGHFVFERNRPATFRHPWLSYLGDWRMWWDMLRGRIAF